MNNDISIQTDRSLLQRKKMNRSFSFDMDSYVKNKVASSKKNWIFIFLLIVSTICSASFGALLLSLPSTPLMKLLWRNIFSAAAFLPLTLIDSPFREFFKRNVFMEKLKRYFVGAFWFTCTSVTFAFSLHHAGLGATCIVANFDVVWIILLKAFTRELKTFWRRIWLGILLCLLGFFFCYVYSQSYWLVMALASSFASTLFIFWGDSVKEKHYWIGYFCLFFISSAYLFGLLILFDGVMIIFNAEYGLFSIFKENTLINVIIVSVMTSIGSTGIMFSISRKITPSLHSLSILIEPTIALCLGSLLGFQEFFAISLWIAIILSISSYILIKKVELKAEDESAENLFHEMDYRDEPEQDTSSSFIWMRKSISYNI